MKSCMVSITYCALIYLSFGCAAPDNAPTSKDLRGRAGSGAGAVSDPLNDDASASSRPSEMMPEPETKTSTQSEPQLVTKEISSSGASIQVKDIALLRSSIEGCMGRDMVRINEDMLIPSDLTVTLPKSTEGRQRFLLAAQYLAGDDIIAKEAANLVDLTNGSRTTNTADSLTDTYLRSLETIANVVAHNCTANNPNCQCGSKEAALLLMNRCLPGLNPMTVEMADTAALMGAVCSESSGGMRRAIASLISSFAFALAR